MALCFVVCQSLSEWGIVDTQPNVLDKSTFFNLLWFCVAFSNTCWCSRSTKISLLSTSIENTCCSCLVKAFLETEDFGALWRRRGAPLPSPQVRLMPMLSHIKVMMMLLRTKMAIILPTGQCYAPSAVINDAWCCMVLHGIALYCIALHGIA